MRRRRLKRQLVWTALLLGLVLLATFGLIARAAGALVPAARRRLVRTTTPA